MPRPAASTCSRIKAKTCHADLVYWRVRTYKDGRRWHGGGLVETTTEVPVLKVLAKLVGTLKGTVTRRADRYGKSNPEVAGVVEPS